MESIKSNNYKIRAYAESRIGGRNENQDSYAYSDTPMGFLAVVCDGMGGMNGGKTASSIAVETIINYVKNAEEQICLEVVLSKSIAEANSAIINFAQNNPELKGMGTTVTALLYNDNAVYIAHVGDSRIYQIRQRIVPAPFFKRENGRLSCKFGLMRRIFRTEDHSIVYELVKKKVITEEQARLSSESNIITRALGIQKDVIVDTKVLSYRKGDLFLLCTDGFHSVMSENELLYFIGKDKDISLVLNKFAEIIDNIGKAKGGRHDNLTAIMLETEQTSIVEYKKKKQRVITSAVAVVLSLLISLLKQKFQKE